MYFFLLKFPTNNNIYSPREVNNYYRIYSGINFLNGVFTIKLNARERRLNLPESSYVDCVCLCGSLYWRAAAVRSYREDAVANCSNRRESPVPPPARPSLWPEPVWLIGRGRTWSRRIDPPPPEGPLPLRDRSEDPRGWTPLRWWRQLDPAKPRSNFQKDPFVLAEFLRTFCTWSERGCRNPRVQKVQTKRTNPYYARVVSRRSDLSFRSLRSRM